MATENHPSTSEGHEGRSDVTQQAQEKAEELGRQARSQVASQIDTQKNRATEQLHTMSSALRRTSDELRDEEEDMVANYMESAARQVENVSDYLRTHSAGELFSEAERYARRQPTMFLGGAMLAGFLGARFLKSTSPEHRREGHRERDHYQQHRSVRKPPEGDYDRVHGTRGTEVPDPSKSEAPTTETMPTMEGAAHGRTESTEGRR